MSEEPRNLLHDPEPLLEAEDRTALRAWLNEQRPSDIAEVVETVDNERRRLIFDLLDTAQAAEVLAKVNEATRAELFELLKEPEIETIVSGLATGHLAALRVTQVFGREVRIAALVALSCAVLGATACSILLRIRTPAEVLPPARLVFAFGTAMFTAVMVATTLGLFLPFLFRRVGIDPAISSGPLGTTANDSISVAIYMTLAVLLAG